jgi:hypothetical protein
MRTRREKGKRTPHHTVAQRRQRVVAEKAPGDLTEGDERDIVSVLCEELEMSPYAKAALRLSKLGVTADKMWHFKKTKSASKLPDYWLDNTYNCLKDSELGLKPVKLI